MQKPLTISVLLDQAERFAEIEASHEEPSLYGVTDGKAVGTYFEQKFRLFLSRDFEFTAGNSARGIDFPELEVDMKVTSIKQPQSSCPFKSARQKIYGLGYHLLIFVYEKLDDAKQKSGRLNILHVIFVRNEQTADFQTTTGLRQIVLNSGNEDDLVAFMQDRFLPVDEIEARLLAQEMLTRPPEIGYLTISNALQWRLQYGRVIMKAGSVEGIMRVR